MGFEVGGDDSRPEAIGSNVKLQNGSAEDRGGLCVCDQRYFNGKGNWTSHAQCRRHPTNQPRAEGVLLQGKHRSTEVFGAGVSSYHLEQGNIRLTDWCGGMMDGGREGGRERGREGGREGGRPRSISKEGQTSDKVFTDVPCGRTRQRSTSDPSSGSCDYRYFP